MSSRRKANKGSFRPGFDPRRHKFTRQHCWLGYAVTYIKHPHLRDWLRMRVRCHRTKKEKSSGPQEEHAPAERRRG